MHVRFPNGTVVRASSLLDRSNSGDSRDFGLYMDARWAPAWPATLLEWDDLGLPRDSEIAADEIGRAFDRAQRGEEVEIGCAGGLGRTGTVLACMAVLAGVAAGDAVGWVRRNYRQEAVETLEQEEWVGWFAGYIKRR